MGGPEGRSRQAPRTGRPERQRRTGAEGLFEAQRPRGARKLGVPMRPAAWGVRGRGNKPRGDGFEGTAAVPGHAPEEPETARDMAATATTMPPMHPARGIRQGHCGRATAPSDRPSRARTATRPTLPPARSMTTGQGFGSGAKGDRGQRHVDHHPPLGRELRRAPADRRHARRRHDNRVHPALFDIGDRRASISAFGQDR